MSYPKDKDLGLYYLLGQITQNLKHHYEYKVTTPKEALKDIKSNVEAFEKQYETKEERKMRIKNLIEKLKEEKGEDNG